MIVIQGVASEQGFRLYNIIKLARGEGPISLGRGRTIMFGEVNTRLWIHAHRGSVPSKYWETLPDNYLVKGGTPLPLGY